MRRAAKRLEDEIEFHRVQGELVEKLGGWLLGLDGRRIPAAQKEVAAGLRKVIRLLRDRGAAKQAALEGVNEIWRVARPELLRAQDLLAHIEQNRTEAERAKLRVDDAKAWAAEATKRHNAEIGRRKEEASRRLTSPGARLSGSSESSIDVRRPRRSGPPRPWPHSVCAVARSFCTGSRAVTRRDKCERGVDGRRLDHRAGGVPRSTTRCGSTQRKMSARPWRSGGRRHEPC